MKRSYDEIMAHIEVTEPMRQRVLDRLRKPDPGEPEPLKKASGRKISALRLRRYLASAACLMLLAAGAVMAPRLTRQNPVESSDGSAAIANGMVEADTVSELSRLVGFEVEEMEALPFQVEKTEYVSYWQTMAQITYYGEGQKVVYRKSEGNEDNSGDYNRYSSVREETVEGRTVTFKGEGEAYTLALWSDADFSYSLRVGKPVSEEKLKDLAASCLGETIPVCSLSF